MTLKAQEYFQTLSLQFFRAMVLRPVSLTSKDISVVYNRLPLLHRNRTEKCPYRRGLNKKLHTFVFLHFDLFAIK